jgi:choice-of-anchor C domain-containing protein
MPPRRPADDDADDPRPPRKGTRRKVAGKSVLPLVLLGGGAAAFLAVVGIVLFFALGKPRSDPTTSATAAAKAGPSGPAKWAAGGATGRPAPAPPAPAPPAPAPPAPTPGPAPAAGTELVTNGSFEDGPEPDAAGPRFTVVPAGAPTIPGWTVTRGSVDYIGPYWQHADGKRSIDLNGNEPGTIAQTIRTRPGAKYRVTFSLAGNVCTGNGGDRTVAVSAAGDRATFTFDTTGHGYEDMGWERKTWEFTATAAETTLEFASTTDDPVACGPALDGVSVVEVGS